MRHEVSTPESQLPRGDWCYYCSLCHLSWEDGPLPSAPRSAPDARPSAHSGRAGLAQQASPGAEPELRLPWHLGSGAVTAAALSARAWNQLPALPSAHLLAPGSWPQTRLHLPDLPGLRPARLSSSLCPFSSRFKVTLGVDFGGGPWWGTHNRTVLTRPWGPTGEPPSGKGDLGGCQARIRGACP